jgi:hypothetical protein
MDYSLVLKSNFNSRLFTYYHGKAILRCNKGGCVFKECSMSAQAPKWITHPVKKWLSAVAVMAAATLAESAWANPDFTELNGLPEELGLRDLAMDVDWSWSWLGLLVLVVALVAANGVRGKRKD